MPADGTASAAASHVGAAKKKQNKQSSPFLAPPMAAVAPPAPKPRPAAPPKDPSPTKPPRQTRAIYSTRPKPQATKVAGADERGAPMHGQITALHGARTVEKAGPDSTSVSKLVEIPEGRSTGKGAAGESGAQATSYSYARQQQQLHQQSHSSDKVTASGTAIGSVVRRTSESSATSNGHAVPGSSAGSTKATGGYASMSRPIPSNGFVSSTSAATRANSSDIKSANKAGALVPAKPSPPALKPAVLPLGHQAVHLYFLQELQQIEVPEPESTATPLEPAVSGAADASAAHADEDSSKNENKGGEEVKNSEPSMRTVRLGALTTGEVVQHYIRPFTRQHSCSCVAAVAGGAADLPGGWCSSDGRFTDDRACLGQAGKAVFGKTTFFVTHAWSYKFKDLVTLLSQHYNSLPAESGWLDVYYWLDIFAVDQNQQFTSNPSSDFSSVIHESQAVLFTIHPLLRPATPGRLWCLYEAFRAHLEPDVMLEMLVDDSGSNKNQHNGQQRSFANAYLELLDRFKTKVVEKLDISQAETSVEADRTALLELMLKEKPAAECNSELKKLLQSLMSDALLRHAFKSGDVEGAKALVGRGAKLHGGMLQLSGLKHAGNEVAVVVGQVMLTNSSIRALLMKRSGVGASGAQALAEALPCHPALTELDLQDNAEVGDVGVAALAGHLPSSSSLQRLVLWNTGTGNIGAAALGKALAAGSSGGAQEADGSSQSGGVNRRCALQDLDLGYNAGITAVGLEALAAGVAANTSLRRLALCRLPAVAAAAGQLGASLGTCTSLSTLHLTGCKLQAQHLEQLMPALCTLPQLTDLRLDENDLGPDTGNALAQLLRGCSKLVTLRVDGNSQLSCKPTMALLGPALAAAPSLQVLGINSTGMTPDAAKALATSLAASHVTELDVSDNGELGDAGAGPLLTALKGHKTLTRLNLSSIGMGKPSAAALLALLGSYPAAAGSGAKGAAGIRQRAAAGNGSGAAAAAAPTGHGRQGNSPIGVTSGAGVVLQELLVVGNDDLPDQVMDEVTAWKTRQWVQLKGLR